MSTKDHLLNKFGRPDIPNATYQPQGHRPSGSGDFFKGSYPYMGMVVILVM